MQHPHPRKPPQHFVHILPAAQPQRARNLPHRLHHPPLTVFLPPSIITLLSVLCKYQTRRLSRADHPQKHLPLPPPQRPHPSTSTSMSMPVLSISTSQ